jgi:hypothetical protein
MLIIEDGTGKADSESYASVAFFKSFAKSLGETPPGDLECEVLLRKAMEPLRRGDAYVGYRASRNQALDWPRTGVVVEGFGFASNELPAELARAQCIYAIEAHKGLDLMPTRPANTQGAIVEETIGPLTTRYAESGMAISVPRVERAERILSVLLRNGGGFRLIRG